MLELRGISKYFGSHPALTGINLKIEAGEIHGLVGLNGSGKSTLLHILFGSTFIGETGGYQGSVILGGKPARFSSPTQAIRAGVGMVHQEFALIPEMTVAENVMLTREKTYSLTDVLLPRDLSLINPARNDREVEQALGRLDIAADPSQIAGQLSLNIRQFVEIAREISRDDLKLLLLDEPTAVLNAGDARQFLQTIRDLAAKGLTIILVSHRLQEIAALCDRLTILREGRMVATGDIKATTLDAVTRSMTRETVLKVSKNHSRAVEQPILQVRNFTVRMTGEQLNGVDLDVLGGEILGLISLSGHGRLAFGAGLAGQLPFSGSVCLKGQRVPPSSSAAMIARGVFFLSEDRNRLGLFHQRSIMENIAFAALFHRRRFLHRWVPGWIRLPDQQAIRCHAEGHISNLAISCTGPAQPVGQLSGGNQQKVRIAHALTLSPELLIVNEPARGVDIAARERILELFLKTNEQHGTTIVIASSELEELRRVCDRIAVLYRGRLHAILAPDADDFTFSRAISGLRVD